MSGETCPAQFRDDDELACEEPEGHDGPHVCKPFMWRDADELATFVGSWVTPAGDVS